MFAIGANCYIIEGLISYGRDMRYILFLLVLLASSFSFAQEASDSEELTNIEEVVTSATRKETALQDTGFGCYSYIKR